MYANNPSNPEPSERWHAANNYAHGPLFRTLIKCLAAEVIEYRRTAPELGVKVDHPAASNLEKLLESLTDAVREYLQPEIAGCNAYMESEGFDHD